MKRYTIAATAVLALLVAWGFAQNQEKKAAAPAADKASEKAGEKPAEKPVEKPAPKFEGKFTDPKVRVSYTLGLNIGGNLRRQGFDPKEMNVDVETFTEGLKDATGEREPQLNEAQRDAAMEEFRKTLDAQREQAETKLKAQGEKNKAEAGKFLADNAKKEGVKTTKSGLQYQVLKEGKGAKPTAEQSVKVHYQGTLMDGKEFDSSYKRNEPISFALNGVIPGWTEGVQLMTVGSKYRFFVPPALAYGEEGRPPVIPPNSLLVFEVELLDIEKAAEKPVK